MKELSIEEKAKAYDEAKLRMSAAYNSNRCTIGFMNEIFPELAESEDERIRKVLIELVRMVDKNPIHQIFGYGDIKYSDMIAWLEKQEIKEHDVCDTCEEKASCVSPCPTKLIEEQKPADKVEPKFKVGDWVVYRENIWKIGNIALENYYELLKTNNEVATRSIKEVDENAHLWTIQDAKDGDVLVASDGSIFLFKCTIDCACKHYVAFTTDNAIKFNEGLEHYWETSRAVRPATKEQRDLLFSKMKEAGYEWDTEKKELKKIEQNPTWSEEDNSMLISIENILIGRGHSFHDKEINWLKSLKNRYTWKPSDEQMDVLLSEVTAWTKGSPKQIVLESLYNDLKKLKC